MRGLGLCFFSEQLEGFLQPFDVSFRLFEVLQKGFLELWMMRSFGHFGQGCHQLTLRME